MKNRFGKLIKNESIKLFSKTSNKVLLILVFALAVVIISGILLLDKFVMNISKTGMSIDTYYENALESIEEDKKIDNEVLREKYIAWDTAYADAIKFFMDHEIGDTWKRQNFLSGVEEAYRNIATFKLITDKKLSYEDLKDDLPDLTDESGALLNYDENTDYKAIVDNLTSQLEEFKKYILELSPKVYYTNTLKSYEEYISEAKQKLKSYESGTITSETKYYIEATKLEIEGYTAVYDAIKYLYDNEIAPDDWRASKLVSGVISLTGGRLQNHAIPEEEFYNSSEGKERFGNSSDYESLVFGLEKSLKRDREALEIADYSLKNNIMPSSLNPSSVKSFFRSGAANFASVLSLIITIIACTIVSSEHTSGTIRLLLIRPRTRFEILNSKYVTLLLTNAAVTVAAYLITFIITIIFGGIGDMFTPDLVYYGTPTHISSLLFTFENLLLSLISSTLLMTIGFFFSVVIRKSSGGIIITVLLTYVSNAATMVAMYVISSSKILGAIAKLTVFPYTDLIAIRVNSLDAISSFYGLTDGFSIIGIIGSMSTMVYGSMSNGISALLGAFVILAHVVLIWFFANLIFKKQEIKN